MKHIFLAFFEISIPIGLIVALLILLTPFLNKRYALKWKYWMWVFLALCLVIPFRRAESFFADTVSQVKAQAVPQSGTIDRDEVSGQDLTPVIQVEIPAQMTTPIEIHSSESRFRIVPLDLIAFVWMAGGLCFLSVHLISCLYYESQVMKKGTIIKDADILRQISEIKRELHIRGSVHAIEYPEAASPMMIGFFEPVLILPKERYSRGELFFILKHELVHLKRRDVFIKLLLVVANAIHWFNPLIWIMRKDAVIDMELSCDERVVQGGDYAMRKAYTETLFSTLNQQCKRRAALSTQFHGGTQIMKKRFKNILNKTESKNGAAMLIGAIMLTISLGTLVGCSAASININNMPLQPKQENALMDEQNEGEQGEELQEEEMKSDELLDKGLQEEPAGNSSADSQPIVEMPQNGQIYGYITGLAEGAATIDRQIWATPESEYWKPEYDDAAGFEVVDAEGGDITYTFSEDCIYSVLENHYNPVVELNAKEFEDYLSKMEYPVLWIIELEDGQIKNIMEQYRP